MRWSLGLSYTLLLPQEGIWRALPSSPQLPLGYLGTVAHIVCGFQVQHWPETTVS